MARFSSSPASSSAPGRYWRSFAPDLILIAAAAMVLIPTRVARAEETRPPAADPPAGDYTLTVSGIMRDTLGAPIGTDFVRHFSVDTVGPAIPGGGLAGLPGGQVIADGGVYSTPFTAFTVVFDEPVSDPAGHTGLDDVTNPSNYLLLGAGPDGDYDTADCAAFAANGNLPLDDDLLFPVGLVTYENNGGLGPFAASLPLAGGALPDGEYRLRVCGTSSIVDPAGNPLNGGTDSSFTFRLLSPNATLPATGFAPGRLTRLPKGMPGRAVTHLGDLWLEIPRLGVQAPIVGVPAEEAGWDVSWLGGNAGWLHGSAYPTWNGNSVLTGHVYDAFGNPGPFVGLNQLWWGDRVIVHLGGQRYTFEVREVIRVGPDQVEEMLRHEERSWVTLVTCRGYDAARDSYRYRLLVRAVLVGVE